MAPKKTIAVLGATGAQGGGRVRAILSDPDGGFTARALTRDPSSEKAKALAEAGAEVVAADLDDVNSLIQAIEGAYGAYCVTNYWEHFSPETELAQARNIVQAADGPASSTSSGLRSRIGGTRSVAPTVAFPSGPEVHDQRSANPCRAERVKPRPKLATVPQTGLGAFTVGLLFHL